MRRKWILLIVISVSVLVLGKIVFWFYFDDGPFMEPLEISRIVDFPALNEKVYIKASAWGIAGNHSSIILSSSPINNNINKYKKDKQFVFVNSTDLYFKKVGVDSLLVYVDYKSDIPINMSSQINIRQIEFKNRDEIMDFKKNYLKYGLEKISVY